MLPHLLVPEMNQAITTSPARRLLVLNLVAQPGETEGYPPEAHLEAVGTHAPALAVDVVVADPTAVPDPGALARAAADLGARLHLAPVRVPGAGRHDPVLLAAAFQAVFGAGPGSSRVAMPAIRGGAAPAGGPTRRTPFRESKE
jgi:hypothetical protein